MNTVAVDAYRECCERRGVRPNVQIISQIRSPASAVELPALDASSTFLGSLGVHALLDFVHLHQGVSHLCLANNGVDASNVQHLYSLMERHQSLGSCDLRENGLSTPSVRLLWELARHVNTVQRLNTEGTGIVDEWKQRLERALHSNEELQVLGFHKYGVERPLTEWGAAYLCVVGPSAKVAHLTDSLIPALNSFVAGMRLRVSPIVITQFDSQDSMSEKLSLCADRANFGLVWCAAFLSRSEPLSPVAEAALNTIAQRSQAPDVPPLHNKLGEIREPLHRFARNLFVVSEPLLDEKSGSQRIDDAEHAAAAAFAAKARPLLDHPCAYGLESQDPASTDLRLVSSLYCSMKIVYSQDPTVLRATTAFDWELPDRMRHIGQLYPTELAEVLRYCEPTASACAFPLVVYGSGSGGKDEILAAAACFLRDSSSALQKKVVPYFVEGESSRSVVLLLYFLLDVFCPQAVAEMFPTLQDLMHRTKKAIEAYEGEAEIILFLSGVEFLTYCDVFNTTTSLMWMPATFPATVRLVLSLRTESPLLLSLRSRSPLPFELLVGGLPMTRRLTHLQRLLALRGRSYAELSDEVIAATKDAAVGARGNTTLDLFAAKEDSDLYLYVTALAAYFSSLGDVPDFAAAMRSAPETTEGLFISLLTSFEQRFGRKLVMSIVLALSSSSLPATELVLICETILGCERYTTVPAVATLMRDGLLASNGANVLRLANTVVAAAVKEHYAAHQTEVDESASAVASHVHRLVTTRSPELLFSFRRVFSLLIQSWQDTVAESLLFDASLIDLVLRDDAASRRYMVDAIYALTIYRARLEELYEGKHAASQFAHDPSRRTLRNLLRDIQQLPRTAFQGALQLAADSPLRQSASRQNPPYVCLLPLNDDNEERLSVFSVAAQAQGLSHCHRFEDVVCATSADQVIVCNAVTGVVLAKSVARPLGLDHTLIGALVASSSEVAVICLDQVALWNLEHDTWSSVLDVTCSLSGNSFDSLRQHLLVVHPSTHHVSLLDIHRRKVASTFGEVFPTGSVREARFLGQNVAIVSIYDVAVLRPSGERCDLSHPSMIKCLSSSVDGKLIAVGVENAVWLWTHTGQHLHVCSGHSQQVLDVAFHASGSTVISCSADQTLRVWNTISGLEKTVLSTDLGEPADFVSFTPDGCKILARCGGYLRQWDSVTYQSTGAVNACAGYISFFCLTNNAIIAATDAGLLKGWSLAQSFATVTQAMELSTSTNILRNSKVAAGHVAVVSAATCGGELLLTLSADGSLRSWSLTRPGPSTLLLSDVLCFVAHLTDPSLGMSRVVILTRALRLSVVDIRQDVEGGSLTTTDAGSFPTMRDAEASADFSLKAFADFSQVVLTMNSGAQTRLCLFDTEQFGITNQLSGHFDTVIMTEPLPGNNFLITASTDCTVRLWNLSAHAERAGYKHSRQLAAASANLSSADSSSVDVVVFDEEGCMSVVRVSLAGQIRVLVSHHIGLSSPRLACRISPTTLIVVCEDGVAVVDQTSMSVANRLHQLDVSIAVVGGLLNGGGELINSILLGTLSGRLLLCRVVAPV